MPTHHFSSEYPSPGYFVFHFFRPINCAIYICIVFTVPVIWRGYTLNWVILFFAHVLCSWLLLASSLGQKCIILFLFCTCNLFYLFCWCFHFGINFNDRKVCHKSGSCNFLFLPYLLALAWKWLFNVFQVITEPQILLTCFISTTSRMRSLSK